MTISIAIPDSSLSDELTKLDKSRKISAIARACAIFKVDTIYLYNESDDKDDNRLMLTVLKYLETPPFLRKSLFPKMNELKFAGVLHPLKISSHLQQSDSKKIKADDFRDGVVFNFYKRKFIVICADKIINNKC